MIDRRARWAPRCWFVPFAAWACAACIPVEAIAQDARVDVVVASDLPADTIAALRAALLDRGVKLEWLADAGGDAECSGLAPDASASARISITWQPRQVATICFGDHRGGVIRELGPFAEIDANAREQLLTVLEAGVDALRARLERAAPASNAAANQEPAASAPETAQPAHAAAHAPDRRASGEADAQPEGPVAAEEAHEPAPVRTSAAAEPEWTLGVGYQPALWNTNAFAHGAGVAFGRSIASAWLSAGLSAGYSPPFVVGGSDLGASVTALKAQLWALLALPIAERAQFDVAAGPALESVSVTPRFAASARVKDTRSVQHFDPLLGLSLGPALGLTQRVWLTTRLGFDLALQGHRFGFERSGGFQTVFESHGLRLVFDIGIRLKL